jgi:membrane protein implicated in regulation of membrane protease activity
MTDNYAVGYAAAGVAVVCFGSNFIPVKKFNTGDGMFFQWIQCAAIWIVGVMVQLIRSNTNFYPVAMLGGFFWATGNIMVVPIVKMIGLGLGLLIWGTSNLVMGWASGRFGLFHLTKQPIDNSILNTIGVVFAVLSVIIFANVRPVSNNNNNNNKRVNSTEDEDEDALEPLSSAVEAVQERTWVDSLSETQKRTLGITGSVISGIFYGYHHYSSSSSSSSSSSFSSSLLLQPPHSQHISYSFHFLFFFFLLLIYF